MTMGQGQQPEQHGAMLVQSESLWQTVEGSVWPDATPHDMKIAVPSSAPMQRINAMTGSYLCGAHQ